MLTQASYFATPDMPEWSNNPLVSSLGEFRSPEKLAIDLYQNPYANQDLSKLPTHILDAKIDRLEFGAFVVTPHELAFAKNLQRMLWNGLARRNPRWPEVMASVEAFSNCREMSIDRIPWSSDWAPAAKVAEITGQGKTHIPKRILRLWRDGIRHGKIDGIWVGRLQLVYLHLDMSHDGNLRGLLQHILNEIDMVFDGETNYAETIPKKATNIANFQVWVIDALKRHFCGLIVIDELQAISLLLGKDAKVVANFFLRLLNQGIPILFEGNPFAFSHFDNISQLSDRLNSVLFPGLEPKGYEDKNVLDHFLPKIWKIQLMKVISPLDDNMKRALYECSAWHRRHIARAMQNGERIALALGADQLTPDHIRRGFQFEVHADVQSRIRAFVNRDPVPIFRWKDIPVSSLISRWEIEDETLINMAAEHDVRMAAGEARYSKDPLELGSEPNAKSKPIVTARQLIAKVKAKVRAQEKREKKQKDKASANVDLATDESDLRKRGLKAALVKSFDDLQSASPSQRPKGMDLEQPPSSGKGKPK